MPIITVRDQQNFEGSLDSAKSSAGMAQITRLLKFYGARALQARLVCRQRLNLSMNYARPKLFFKLACAESKVCRSNKTINLTLWSGVGHSSTLMLESRIETKWARKLRAQSMLETSKQIPGFLQEMLQMSRLVWGKLEPAVAVRHLAQPGNAFLLCVIMG